MSAGICAHIVTQHQHTDITSFPLGHSPVLDFLMAWLIIMTSGKYIYSLWCLVQQPSAVSDYFNVNGNLTKVVKVVRKLLFASRDIWPLCELLFSTSFFFSPGFRQLHPQTPCLTQSLSTWAPPSSRLSSSTPPWRTPSWNTCACWTSTPSPPQHATLASSAPSVGQHSLKCLTYGSLRFMFALCILLFFSSVKMALIISLDITGWREPPKHKSFFSPKFLQGQPPALWIYWRRWSSLEWTLLAWTSPMAHTRCVFPQFCRYRAVKSHVHTVQIHGCVLYHRSVFGC